MNNKGFIVLQGDNPYTDMDNDPAYFRGRFATYEEAITGCEDIFRRDFERLEKMAIAEGFSWKDLDSYLFVYYYPPWIRNPWDRPAGVSEYDEFSAYCRHRSALIKRLRLTKFRIGDRVHLTRPHSGLPKGVEVGYVIGASFYDTDIYPDDIVSPCTEVDGKRADFCHGE